MFRFSSLHSSNWTPFRTSSLLKAFPAHRQSARIPSIPLIKEHNKKTPGPQKLRHEWKYSRKRCHKKSLASRELLVSLASQRRNQRHSGKPLLYTRGSTGARSPRTLKVTNGNQCRINPRYNQLSGTHSTLTVAQGGTKCNSAPKPDHLYGRTAMHEKNT